MDQGKDGGERLTSIQDLDWQPNPLLPSVRVAERGGFSVIHGEFVNGYEIMVNGDVTSGLTADEVVLILNGDCIGHVASDNDNKVCRFCGTHSEEERPDDDQ
jgi:hypothetical protein